MSLIQLNENKKAKITSLEGGHCFRERLISMGLNVGREIEKKSSGHGPVVIKATEITLIIGVAMAHKIIVEEV